MSEHTALFPWHVILSEIYSLNYFFITLNADFLTPPKPCYLYLVPQIPSQSLLPISVGWLVDSSFPPPLATVDQAQALPVLGMCMTPAPATLFKLGCTHTASHLPPSAHFPHIPTITHFIHYTLYSLPFSPIRMQFSWELGFGVASFTAGSQPL